MKRRRKTIRPSLTSAEARMLLKVGAPAKRCGRCKRILGYGWAACTILCPTCGHWTEFADKKILDEVAREEALERGPKK